MRGPDLPLLLRFLPSSSNGARLALDAIVGLPPLVDPIAHGIWIHQTLPAHSQPGDDDHMLVDYVVTNLRSDVLQPLETNVQILTAPIVPGLRGNVNRADGVAMLRRHLPVKRLVLLGVPEDESLFQVAPDPVDHAGRDRI